MADAMFTQQSWPSDWAADVGALDPGKLAYLESIGRYLVAAAAAMVDELVSFARSWLRTRGLRLVQLRRPGGRGGAWRSRRPAPVGTDSAQRLEFSSPVVLRYRSTRRFSKRFAVDVRTARRPRSTRRHPASAS